MLFNKTINMYFASSKVCNLNCQYCYVPKNYKSDRRQDQQILEKLKQFIAKVEQEGYRIGSFVFHGAEPALMSADTLAEAVQMVSLHWDQNGLPQKAVGIQSNGTLWNEKYLTRLAELLPEKPRLRLGFSIDPPGLVHDTLRDRSFQKVSAHYQNALELGFPVSVLSVVSPLTLEHLDGFGDWMQKQLKLKAKTGNPFKVKIKLATGDLGFPHDQIENFTQFLIEKKLLELLQVFTPGYCIQDGNDCFWFEFDLEGNCYSCNKQFNKNGVFASWYQNDFDQIFIKRRNLFQSVITHPDCEQCPYQLICNSGCPADRTKSGAYAGKAHECKMIQTVGKYLEAEGISLADFMNRM